MKISGVIKRVNTLSHYDVIIIGAGASGLMCAATAAKQGKRVLVLEKANKVGKKILMSGGGKCNFTNYEVSASNYICTNPHFCKSALKQYSQWDFFALVNEYGIEWEERKHGQLFCLHSAKDILHMLLAECEKAEAVVDIQTKVDIQSIQEKDHVFTVNTSQQAFTGQHLVIASGALSIPSLGGSGFGYKLAQQFNIPVLPRQAGLVPYTITDQLKPVCERLSGLAIEVEVSLGETSFTENMLFTHRGFSGPVMLQISNYWQRGDTIRINLLPHINLLEKLLQTKKHKPKILLRSFFQGLLTKNLVLELQQLFWVEHANTPLAEIPDKLLESVSHHLQAWQIKPADTEGYRTAEVTLGGVDTDYISSKTFEVKHQKGLYFIGEVLDVSGQLGGFNFQWAWSSGFACATHIAAR